MSENIDLSQFLAGVSTEELMKDDRSPLPEGEYTVEIESMEIKDTKRGNGKYIKVQFNVLGPKQIGRKLWTNINVVNPNPTAVSIGQKELYKLTMACGLPAVSNTNMYLGKRLTVLVVVDDDGSNNEIKKYIAIEKGKATVKPVTKPAIAAPPNAPPNAPSVEGVDTEQEGLDFAATETAPWDEV